MKKTEGVFQKEQERLDMEYKCLQTSFSGKPPSDIEFQLYKLLTDVNHSSKEIDGRVWSLNAVQRYFLSVIKESFETSPVYTQEHFSEITMLNSTYEQLINLEHDLCSLRKVSQSVLRPFFALSKFPSSFKNTAWYLEPDTLILNQPVIQDMLKPKSEDDQISFGDEAVVLEDRSRVYETTI